MAIIALYLSASSIPRSYLLSTDKLSSKPKIELMEKIYRSKKDRILFGVCSGIAKYFKVDPTLIRIIFVVAVVLEPKFILIYLILAIIMPEEERGEGWSTDGEVKRSKRLLPYVLIAFGTLILIKDITPLSFLQYFGAFLIVLGILLLLKSKLISI